MANTLTRTIKSKLAYLREHIHIKTHKHKKRKKKLIQVFVAVCLEDFHRKNNQAALIR